MGTIKILILTANPSNTGVEPLRLDAEVRHIEEAIRRSSHRDRFVIATRLAVRTVDLRRALLEHRPQVLHFSGHGTEKRGLVLENDAGKVQLVSTDALGRLFGSFDESPVECVLLNACYSEAQAAAIHQYVDCVIGMNQPIGDQAAIQFAEGFYDALGAGSTYAEAFNFGCSAIDLDGSSEYLTPQLIGGKQSRAISPVDQDLAAVELTPPPSPPVGLRQSQTIGSVTISGNNNPFNVVQAGRDVNVHQTNTQGTGSNSYVETALTLLGKLKQDVATTDALSGLAKKDTEARIGMLQEELQKPEPDRDFINEIIDALRQGLSGVLTLAAPVAQVAALLGKAWGGWL